jgi:hypothetical protein
MGIRIGGLFMTRIVAALSLAVWVACTTPLAAQTIEITRPSNFLYAIADAAIEVNGTKVAGLSNGATYKGPVRPGPVTIVVTNWQSPGRSVASFRAVPGKTYRFTVTPRGESMAAGLALGLIGAALEGGGMFQISRR